MRLVNNEKSFTLVEVLVSAAILGYALSAVLVSFNYHMALTQASRNLTTATTHAEYVLEGIRNASFSTICTAIYNDNWNWGAAYATTISSQGLTPLNGESIITTTTTPLLQCGTAVSLTVTTTISWNDLRQRSQTKSFTTLISG